MRRDRSARRATLTAGLLGVALLAGACGSPDDPERRADPPPATEAGPDAVPTPQPFTPEAYKASLAAIGGPLSSTFSALVRANTPAESRAALAPAREAALKAMNDFGAVEPPPELATEHFEVTHRLAVLYGELMALDPDANGDRSCGKRSYINWFGRNPGLDSLAEAFSDLNARGKAGGYKITFKFAKPAKLGNKRLGNGTVVRGGSGGGGGQLVVDNGTDQDAVVTLARGKQPVTSMYVRGGGKATIRGVADGTYRVYFASGVNWSSNRGSFTRDCAYERFDDSFEYSTTRTATYVEHDVWNVGLQKSIAGNAQSSTVDPDDFPG